MEFTALTPTHGDVVNDISFDFYGKRFATCSSDKDIKVWDLVSDPAGTNTSHDASDGNGTTRWQEVTIPRAHQDSIWRISWSHPEFGQLFASCSQDKTVHIWEEQEGVSKSENRDKWIRKMQLSDSKGSVNDVKFGPRHVGLKVAAGSADGCIRIYEATDVFALNYWSLQSTLVANDGGIGVGADESSVNCLSWNECPFEPPYMVAGYSFGAILWAERGGKWTEEMKLSQDRPVYDIAWAAGMGRSYHLIAAVDRTKTFKVYKVRRESEGKLVYDSCMEVEAPSSVWRVAWNATGTVLATSTESGDLDLWRRDFKGNWVSVQSIPSSIPSTRSFYNMP